MHAALTGAESLPEALLRNRPRLSQGHGYGYGHGLSMGMTVAPGPFSVGSWALLEPRAGSNLARRDVLGRCLGVSDVFSLEGLGRLWAGSEAR